MARGDPADRDHILAIVSTKISILLGQDIWIFHLPKMPHYGFWSMAQEARADVWMLPARSIS